MNIENLRVSDCAHKEDLLEITDDECMAVEIVLDEDNVELDADYQKWYRKAERIWPSIFVAYNLVSVIKTLNRKKFWNKIAKKVKVKQLFSLDKQKQQINEAISDFMVHMQGLDAETVGSEEFVSAWKQAREEIGGYINWDKFIETYTDIKVSNIT